MNAKLPALTKTKEIFIASKENIIANWLAYGSPKKILFEHKIESDKFINNYAGGVFDYFMGVISGDVEIGNCPVMQDLLAYLKDREISAGELFELCSHFRRSMIDFTYDANVNSKEVFDEISYIFDKNFQGILKFYTDTLFQRLIDARHEAMQASQAREYFLSNMSHEIRTPLNAILGFVNVLIEENISKKHRNYLDIILNSGENLLSIINDILDFSKLRSGEFTIEPKNFSLHEELSHTMELFVASANLKDITITSYIDPAIPKELYADALRIKQILSNFLSNAIKFTPHGGVISIEATCHNQRLKISVEDTGIGIVKEDLQNIFTAFAQAQYTQLHSSNGTGLGLSICSQLTEHMGGFVDVKSVPGVGSIFWIEIPVEIYLEQCLVFENIEKFKSLKLVLYAKDKNISFRHISFLRYANTLGMDIEVVENFDGEFDVAIFVYEEIEISLRNKIENSEGKYIALMSKNYDVFDKYQNIFSMCFPLYCSKIYGAFHELLNPHADSPYAKKISPSFKGHILVAEDNEANQELIKILLTKYGLSFDLAGNGLEAFKLYQKNRYDLILMDEQMPVMDGNEAISAILKYEKAKGLKHTPVSTLTANVIKGAKERGLLSGFDSFLGKPIVLKELERVFLTYLEVNSKDKMKLNQSSNSAACIQGLDAQKLTEELMLSYEELLMLLGLFIKKMQTSLPELSKAIKQRDYKNIARLAHSIKGSSANFRIEFLQNHANEMEQMAKKQSETYDFEDIFNKIKMRVAEISLS
jgi:signal transduction histidine kinase/DNA-binding response OmpR family regulator